MKIVTKKTIALGTLAVMATAFTGPLTTPVQAQSKDTWKKLAIAGGVVTGYGLLKKKKTVAIIGGVGTAYAYTRYRSAAKKKEARREAWYRSRYGRNWRNYYKAGA